MNGVRRRPERPEDRGFLRAVFVERHAALFAGLDEELRAMLLDQQFRAQDIGYRTAYPDARFDVIESLDRPIGRIVSERSLDAVSLIDVAVVADVRGGGVATALIDELCREAAEAGLPVRLRVAVDNGGARRLYERLGFRVVATDAVGFAMEWNGSAPPPARA